MTVADYIKTYKDLAIREMERSGIPASITLAQGIHESGCGNGELATRANNHFGIKCGKTWQGDTLQKWDDDPEQSCFRAYTNAEASYIDHTDFLLKRKHYAFLFEYSRTDYKNWAKGLRKAGYATDPNYPDKLINTIEKHQLSQFDSMGLPILIYDTTTVALATDDVDETVLNAPDNFNRKLRQKPRSFLFVNYRKGIFRQNHASYVVAQKGESALSVATRLGIPYKRFLKFNDMRDGDGVIEFQYMYLQPKKSSYKGDAIMHRIENDETMYELAQFYGIRLHALLQRNGLSEGEEPASGELILLKEKAVSRPKLRPKDYIDRLPIDSTQTDTATVAPVRPVAADDVPRPQPKPLDLDAPTYRPDVNTTGNLNTTAPEDTAAFHPARPTYNGQGIDPNTLFGTPPTPANIDTIRNTTPTPNVIINTTNTTTNTNNQADKANSLFDKTPTPAPVPPVVENGIRIHTVAQGETLYKVARLYQTTPQAIIQLNGLTDDKIKVKQVLKIPSNQ